MQGKIQEGHASSYKRGGTSYDRKGGGNRLQTYFKRCHMKQIQYSPSYYFNIISPESSLSSFTKFKPKRD